MGKSTRRQPAVTKASVKQAKKSPTKTASASKTAKKVAPAKKPTKPAGKPAKAKAPEKKTAAPAPKSAPAEKAKAPAPVKKVVASQPAKKDEAKKAAPPAASKVATKKDMQDKIAKPAPSVAKKTESAAASARPGASAQAKTPAQPIKVEPKIIETSQPEFIPRMPDEQLFSQEELDHFRELLLSERNKILAKARRAMEEGNIQIDRDDMFDEVDQASAMIDQNLTFRLLDRDRKLLSEIDHAIAKLESGDFGYCEGTGEPIPKRRLELRPWCRHSVKYKEKLERMKKSGRGVVDEDEV